MERASSLGLSSCDVAVLVVDAKQGPGEADAWVATWLRSRAGSKPVLVVGNKAEGKVADGVVQRIERLGFGTPVMVSAEHGHGLADLYIALAPIAWSLELNSGVKKPLPRIYAPPPPAGNAGTTAAATAATATAAALAFSGKGEANAAAARSASASLMTKSPELQSPKPSAKSPLPLDVQDLALDEGDDELLQATAAENPDGIEIDPGKPVALAIIGRPNAGKSTDRKSVV